MDSSFLTLKFPRDSTGENPRGGAIAVITCAAFDTSSRTYTVKVKGKRTIAVRNTPRRYANCPHLLILVTSRRLSRVSTCSTAAFLTCSCRYGSGCHGSSHVTFIAAGSR